MSVQLRTVEQFFDGAPTALGLYEAVERMAAGLGPFGIRVGKSQISFRRRRGFAYLWRPGLYVKSAVPLVLSLALPRDLGSPRFKQIVHPSAQTWMHHLELTDSTQLDAEVRTWMQEAYGAAG
ncbi:DUF5655 domain-containing protein [Arthrobacter sp. FW306-05-C]|uniref:DUF5655 domain-containing protein n=1 Tax=Arthrobacter TaxID=1663 RepID=UPI001EF01B8D|nr:MULTISPECIES: DUF5655 domain-containing protein [Arthrobacter]MDP9986616.1 hypothetical protein [Arthrobacter oryzae]UKA65115.1 DUF5655 domain-containing protein [Arthrobacter sp. FW306-05-C]UKA69419.1 DUF5655 domain-containing protein [Arthrobacter sp. FW306-06-A]UKA73787.1 DUF5655 domain-containing protein [Arthrobacter sp. FW306-07-I]